MSWAEVHKINENTAMNKFNNATVLTASTTFTVPKTGYYKIFCVGAGGSSSTSGSTANSGSGGGVAEKTAKLDKNQTYTVTVGTTVSFVSTLSDTTDKNYISMSATSGTTGGDGGTATGFDSTYLTYTGESGSSFSSGIRQGGSVGCYVTSLMEKNISLGYSTNSAITYSVESGLGICGLGGGGGVIKQTNVSHTGNNQNGGVVIIPLGVEMI